MNNINTVGRELEILEQIYRNQARLRQRDLAKIVGLSLGMTNAIIKRLVQKGWLKARKINERNIHYIVSPQGIEAIAKKSYRYLKRTVRNVVLYKEAIERYIHQARREGFRGIALVGPSDLDFIVEHLCLKHRLEFHRQREPGLVASGAAGVQDGLFCLYSESVEPPPAARQRADGSGSAHLRDILINL